MKTIITFFAILLLLCSPIVAQTAVAPAGSGTQSDPYKIANIENLYWLSQTDTAWGAHYEQTANIDASETKNWDSGKGFFPIGNNATKFTGSYNGQGYTIDNLGLTNINIQGSNYTGGLVEFNFFSSEITNC